MRDCKPLHPEPARPSAGFDVFALTTAFVDIDGLPWSTLTMLIDFTGDPSVSRVVRQLDGVVLNSRSISRRFSGPRAVRDFADFVDSHQTKHLLSVLVLPGTAECLDEVAAVAERLPQRRDGENSCTVGVTAAPEAWSAVPSLVRHIRSDAAHLAADAAGVFKMFTVPGAPALIGCVDADDIAEVLTDTTAALFCAFWHRQEQLLDVPPGLRVACAGADGLVVAPLWTDARIREFSHIRRTLRQLANDGVAMTVAASVGHFAGCELARDIVPVLVLCATRTDPAT